MECTAPPLPERLHDDSLCPQRASAGPVLAIMGSEKPGGATVTVWRENHTEGETVSPVVAARVSKAQSLREAWGGPDVGQEPPQWSHLAGGGKGELKPVRGAEAS